MDYSYLWNWADGKSEFFLQLEDDIIAQHGFLSFIEKSQLSESDPWFVLEFSTLGFIGKLFRTENLKLLTEYVMVLYKSKPVDWLMEEFVQSFRCTRGMEWEKCLKQQGNNKKIQ